MVDFLYTTPTGRACLKVVANPVFSKLINRFVRSNLSWPITRLYMDNHDVEIVGYSMKNFSLNALFTRESLVNYVFNVEEDEVPAVADSMLTVYPISEDLRLNIKHSVYSLEDLTGIEYDRLGVFKDGYCLVFRLRPEDYHWFHAVDEYEVVLRKHLGSELHSVRPVAKDYDAYIRNKRIVQILKTDHFGTVCQVLVGSLFVGDIRLESGLVRKKLDIDGHFELGGSTVVLLMDKNVSIRGDIVWNSKNGVETGVRIGIPIGVYTR